ncbi:MAG: 2-oxoacid:acceptor oxidoreductase family protein [Tissierellia bacterium]|nr:2-oxoacid:acceptor oxidoreductase family protein [Tissierellia bacterium]
MKGRTLGYLSFERLEALRYLHYLKEDGILIVNDQRIDPMGVITEKEEYPENIFEELKKHRHFYPVDALAMAKDLGNVKVFNTIILGLLSRFLEFSEESWLKVIRETVPKKTIETNIKAFLWGRKGEQI